MSLESIFGDVSSGVTVTAATLLTAEGAALILGLLVSLVYGKTHRTRRPSQSFALTLVVLPAVITVIILLVGNSVARAFSLAGAFSIIRFRSAPGDPKDITYVLFAMAVGLACGMGYLLFAGLAAAVLCAAVLLLEALQYGGSRGSRGKLLKITVPEDLDYQRAFDDILEKHTDAYKLVGVKTSNLGSLFELRYEITQKAGDDEKAFIDELRCRNGNLNITLVLAAEQGEFTKETGDR
jgi:hypothetical protein